VYRLVPSDLRQAGAVARLIDGNGYRAIVPMWRAGIWGDDISSAAGREFAALGGTVYPGVRFDPEATVFSADLAALEEQVADARARFADGVAVAFFSFGTEGAAVLAQAADVPALGAVTWFGSDGTALSREILGDPRAAQFAVQTGFFNTLFGDVHTRTVDGARARIAAAIGGGVHFCAMAASDAVWLAALGAAVAGTEDVAGFKRALVAIADAYEGATGPTTLDAAGDRADAVYDVWAIEEEGGEYVWTRVAPR
jgi:branched-chain amino acid transport system substrate-binding protein